MATITAADVKKLRDATGAGMMDAKKALTEADGDFDAAIEILRVTGQAKMAKRSDREASNGLVASAGKTVIQLGAETDFVAKNAEFIALADEIATAVDAAGAHGVEAAKAVVAAVRQDRGRGRRRAERQDRREARAGRGRHLRRPGQHLPAQAVPGPAAAGRRHGRVRRWRRGLRPRHRDADRGHVPVLRHPRRGARRRARERAQDRRADRQGGGQARGDHPAHRRGSPRRLLQGGLPGRAGRASPTTS